MSANGSGQRAQAHWSCHGMLVLARLAMGTAVWIQATCQLM